MIYQAILKSTCNVIWKYSFIFMVFTYLDEKLLATWKKWSVASKIIMLLQGRGSLAGQMIRFPRSWLYCEE